MRILVNGMDIAPILVGAPAISDQLESVCRTLEFSVKDSSGLDNKLGQIVELYYNDERWFIGTLRKRGRAHDGVISYLVYDPMIFLLKNVDDFYYDKMTAKQIIKDLAESSAIKVYKLDNTRASLPPLYYQGAEADKVAIDVLVRTYNENGKKYWIRYNPGVKTEGLELFERVMPKKLWSFQVGINLTTASMEESIEDTITAVKLINRDTGKIVQRVDATKLRAYGKTVYFEEIDKDKSDTMELQAKKLLDSLSGLAITQTVEGINPDGTMPQLYSGDFIYVEEKYTHIMGGYHIRNVTQTIVNDNLVTVSLDIERNPYVPEVQFDDATEDPSKKDDETESDSVGGSGNKSGVDKVVNNYKSDKQTVVTTPDPMNLSDKKQVYHDYKVRPNRITEE